MLLNRIASLLFLPLFFISSLSSFSQSTQRPKPSPVQQQWMGMEFYLFAHFGPNTFTDLEWGKGSEKEEVFNPTNLDCKQWCRIAKGGWCQRHYHHGKTPRWLLFVAQPVQHAYGKRKFVEGRQRRCVKRAFRRL